MGFEGVVAEIAGFELHARFENGGVIGAADEGDVDVEGGLWSGRLDFVW